MNRHMTREYLDVHESDDMSPCFWNRGPRRTDRTAEIDPSHPSTRKSTFQCGPVTAAARIKKKVSFVRISSVRHSCLHCAKFQFTGFSFPFRLSALYLLQIHTHTRLYSLCTVCAQSSTRAGGARGMLTLPRHHVSHQFESETSDRHVWTPRRCKWNLASLF